MKEPSVEKKNPLIAGNWKMFKTRAEAINFMEVFVPLIKMPNCCNVVIAPSFTALEAVRIAKRGTHIELAGQNVHWKKEGAETGEISPAMLAGAGCRYVIVGHSERRQNFKETDQVVNEKVKSSLSAGLLPIVCLGEKLDQRDSGETRNVLGRQFKGAFAGLTAFEFSRIIIAYEPVWAIGTGRAASPETAMEVHSMLRGFSRDSYGSATAESLRILYGGSVKPDNISSLLTQDHIDGALVGGASLDPDSFAAIVNSCQGARDCLT